MLDGCNFAISGVDPGTAAYALRVGRSLKVYFKICLLLVPNIGIKEIRESLCVCIRIKRISESLCICVRIKELGENSINQGIELDSFDKTSSIQLPRLS